MAYKSIRTLILENAVCEKPLSARDLANLHRIKPSTVHRQMTRLRAQGLIPKSNFQRKRGGEYSTASGYDNVPPPPPPPQHPIWKQQDVDAIVNSEVMPELERLQKLSHMARNGPDAISIAAIKAIEDLSRARGSTVGPQKPLTEEEAVARLVRLCMALGRELSEKALSVAFPTQEAGSDELSTQTGEKHQGPPSSSSLVD